MMYVMGIAGSPQSEVSRNSRYRHTQFEYLSIFDEKKLAGFEGRFRLRYRLQQTQALVAIAFMDGLFEFRALFL